MAETIGLRVSRFRPETDKAPHFEDFDVPLRRDWTVLDGLNHVKDELDPTLA